MDRAEAPSASQAPGGADAGAAAPAARLQAVRKRFGYRETLRGVSLEVPRGSCFVIAGPNGAGKSTLLRILATQWTPSSGRVEVLGPHRALPALPVVVLVPGVEARAVAPCPLDRAAEPAVAA